MKKREIERKTDGEEKCGIRKKTKPERQKW